MTGASPVVFAAQPSPAVGAEAGGVVLWAPLEERPLVWAPAVALPFAEVPAADFPFGMGPCAAWSADAAWVDTLVELLSLWRVDILGGIQIKLIDGIG